MKQGKTKGPKRQGSLVTSMALGGLGTVPARKPKNQGGSLVGGMPPTFGVGKGSGAKTGSRPSRKKMY